MTNKLFVYGTLVGRYENAEKAKLTNADKRGLCITPEEGSEVQGELIEVNGRELQRLDQYEGTPTNYKRVKIDDHEGEPVEVYIGNPDYRELVDHDYENLEEEFQNCELTTQ